MAETSVIDLRDRKNPPPDDPVSAPFGYRWDTGKREWVVKRSAGGRKAGAAWFGKKEPEPEPVFDEFEQEFEKDPAPAHMTAPRKSSAKTPVRVSKKTKDDMAGALGMIGVLLIPLSNADPYCGGALVDNYEKIVTALIPLLCKSQTVVNFFAGETTDWMLWINLIIAMSPVAVAVGKHHILRTVEIQQDKESGDLFVVQRDMTGYATDAS